MRYTKTADRGWKKSKRAREAKNPGTETSVSGRGSIFAG